MQIGIYVKYRSSKLLHVACAALQCFTPSGTRISPLYIRDGMMYYTVMSESVNWQVDVSYAARTSCNTPRHMLLRFAEV